MQERGITWLASYPKSGNTWLRSFLHAYLNPEAPLDLNALESPIASNRVWLDELLGIELGDLPPSAIPALLPTAYRTWASHAPSAQRLVKTHDAFRSVAPGELLFPLDISQGVVHLVRDPRDVAVSLAHHSGHKFDQAITHLNDAARWIAQDKREVKGQIPQFLSDWSTHTQTWLAAPLPRLTLRYEDLCADAVGCFTQVVTFCGLELQPSRLAHGLAVTQFERLQAQEAAGGFRERPGRASAPFFRVGKAGTWREVLTPAQVERITVAHAAMMQHFGYVG